MDISVVWLHMVDPGLVIPLGGLYTVLCYTTSQKIKILRA